MNGMTTPVMSVEEMLKATTALRNAGNALQEAFAELFGIEHIAAYVDGEDMCDAVSAALRLVGRAEREIERQRKEYAISHKAEIDAKMAADAETGELPF